MTFETILQVFLAHALLSVIGGVIAVAIGALYWWLRLR